MKPRKNFLLFVCLLSPAFSTAPNVVGPEISAVILGAQRQPGSASGTWFCAAKVQPDAPLFLLLA